MHRCVFCIKDEESTAGGAFYRASGPMPEHMRQTTVVTQTVFQNPVVDCPFYHRTRVCSWEMLAHVCSKGDAKTQASLRDKLSSACKRGRNNYFKKNPGGAACPTWCAAGKQQGRRGAAAATVGGAAAAATVGGEAAAANVGGVAAATPLVVCDSEDESGVLGVDMQGVGGTPERVSKLKACFGSRGRFKSANLEPSWAAREPPCWPGIEQTPKMLEIREKVRVRMHRGITKSVCKPLGRDAGNEHLRVATAAEARAAIQKLTAADFLGVMERAGADHATPSTLVNV